tara:strand:+ start:942 stop:1649 length:708 start_codon:yes stop_codon:yes gene_type:complete
MGNFGWDDIYEKFPQHFNHYVHKFKHDYSKASYLLRFPFSMKMDWSIKEVSLGLTLSKPRVLPNNFLKEIALINKPLVLVCFGGMGFEFDYGLYNLWPDFLFLTLPTNSFEKEKIPNNLFNVVTLPTSYRIIDALPYCSRIICKPGFSTFCEAISNKLGVHSVNRDGFPESFTLTKGLQDYASHRLLTKESFINGQWELDIALRPPMKNNLIKTDGAFVAAKKIIEFINKNLTSC